jgi:ketosteroid isomerase-like protein
VVDAAIHAWNAGDIGALKALYADDAVVCFPDWGDECTTGAEDIGAWIDELVTANFGLEPASVETEGDTVTVVAKVWADPTRELGIAPLMTTDVYTIQGASIASQTSTLTEASAAKLAEAMAALASQPSAVVTAYVEAINAGDLDAAMDLCHEELYADLLPTLLPEIQNLFGGKKDDIRTWLEEAMALHLEVEMEIISEVGDKVTARSEIWSDHLEALDAAPITVNEVISIRDGQLKSWSRTITASSTRRLLEGLARAGISATFAPQAGEALVSQTSDIAGIWRYTLIGEPAELEFDPDGDFYIRGPSGKVGNTAQYWFEEGLLLIETKRASRTDYCGNGTGGYVVLVNRAGDKPAMLRVHKVFDLCDLRSGALTGDPLTPGGK